MGRPKGSKNVLSELSSYRISTIKQNISERLAVLGVAARVASIENGRTSSWIGDVISEGRYDKKLSIPMVTDIAEALGVAFADLCDDRKPALKRIKEAPLPEWLLAYRRREAEREARRREEQGE